MGVAAHWYISTAVVPDVERVAAAFLMARGVRLPRHEIDGGKWYSVSARHYFNNIRSGNGPIAATYWVLDSPSNQPGRYGNVHHTTDTALGPCWLISTRSVAESIAALEKAA